MKRVSDTHDLAKRLARALRDTGVIVVDRRLVDIEKLSRIITVAGIDTLVSRYAHGDLVVYYFRDSAVEARCRQIECRESPPEHRRACIAECYNRELKKTLSTIERNILEAAEALDE
ncbi:MAG: hypothetical protein F7C34_02160 [Desulfurococcales archaeon]|nr:hypothetical protein [Desulfurococcales archaeon]